jgi:hypothetical protein
MAKANTVDTVIAAVAVDTAAPVELTPAETVVLARRASAEAVGRAYGADRAYAVALNNLLAPKWYDETADSITDLGKVVKAEKKEYFKALKAYAPDHSNPSTNWKRIRKYGREEAEGEPEKGEGAEGGEGEGEGEGGNGIAPLQDRLIGFLHSAYKAYHRDETPNQACRNSIGDIKNALLSLGMDVDADPDAPKVFEELEQAVKEALAAEGESETPDF